MPDDGQENQPLDKDILQCRADLREAIGAIDGADVDRSATVGTVNNGASANAVEPVKDDEIFLEAELAASDSVAEGVLLSDFDPKAKPSKSAPIRILSFDALQKNAVPEVASRHIHTEEPPTNKMTSNSHATEATATANGSETEREQEDRLQKLEEKIQKKTSLLSQQEQRLSFIEKNLLNAVVLERAKFGLRQDVENLNNQNKQLAEEKQRVDEDNQRLVSEIAELKNASENIDAANSRIEQLRKELEKIQLFFSDKKTQVEKLEGTIKTLENDLTTSQQNHQKQLEELPAKKEELQQLTSKYDQLRDEYEHFRSQRDGELEKMAVQLKDSEKSLDPLQTELEQIRHEYEALQTQSGGEIQTLTEKKSFLEHENHSLSDEIARLKNEVEDLRVAETDGQRLRKELESIELTLSHERADMRNLAGTVKALEEDLANTHQDKQYLSEEMAAKEQALEQLQSKYEQLQNEYERFRHQEDTELENLSTQLKHSNGDLNQFKTELEQTRHEYEALQTQTHGEIETLTEKTAFLQRENQMLSEEVSRLNVDRQEEKEISEKLQSAKLDFKNAHEELLDERQRSENLQREHERVTSVLSEAQQERESLLKQQQQLQAQINDLQKSASPAPAENFDVPEEVLSESVSCHHEAPGNIPSFNLAEQIIEEQRRSAASRRQRVKPVSSTSQGTSIKSVVQQYIRSASPSAVAATRKTEIDHHPWIDQSLTPFQQEILEEIIRKDMAFYSRKHPSSAKYQSMNN